ncbi:MAG: hypothetical protein KJO98_12900, partial [Rhodothermia bacterium]|nr:hypothetical protein [Rhodothermia bacterium]
LAGERPFEGERQVDFFRSILNDDPIWPTDIAQTVPEEMRRVVSAMLRKDRDVRYQSIDDLLIDLGSLRDDGCLRSPLHAPADEVKGWRYGYKIAASVLLVVVALLLLFQWLPSRTVDQEPFAASELPAPRAVAVFPFSEEYSPTGGIGNRLALELSRELFDAAVITSVDYNTIQARTGGMAVVDPAVARTLTAGLEGDQFILGRVTPTVEGVDVNASLYDDAGQFLTQATAIASDANQSAPLVDALLQQLLPWWEPELSADHIRGRHSIARAAGTTESGAALKQFVLALYSGDSAQEDERLKRALELDSTFAMAAFVHVREMMGNNVTATKQDAGRSLPLLLRYRHELPEVEAGLTEIYTQNLLFEEKRRKYVDLLDVNQQDGALWEEYGEFLFLNGYKNGWRTLDALAPLLRARDLNGFPRFLLRDIGLLQGDLSLVSADLDYQRTRGAPDGRWAFWYESALEDAAARDDLAEFERLLGDHRRFHPYRLTAAADRIAQYAKDIEYPRRIARVFVTAPDLTANWREWGRYIDAQMDVASGRLKSGTGKMLDLAEENPAFVMHAVLVRFGSHVPNDSAVWSELDRRVARWDTLAADWPFTTPNPLLNAQEAQRSFLRAIIAFRQENWTNFDRHLNLLSRSAEVKGESSRSAAMRNTLTAWRLWKDGRLEEALALLDRAQRDYDPPEYAYQSWITDQLLDRYLRAKILYAQGEYETALTWYLSLNDRGRGCFYAVWAIGPVFYLAGDINEKLGQPELATRHYRRLIDFWSDADGELQQYVDSARVRVERLVVVAG